MHLFVCAVSYIDNSPAKLDSLPDFERGFKPACEVETGAFDPRTTFGRPGIPHSPLITQPYGFVCQASQRLSVVHELGFRPACKVKTGTFDPRTVFGRPGIPRSPLNLFLIFLFCFSLFSPQLRLLPLLVC